MQRSHRGLGQETASIAFLFSGHGAQTYQMGRALYDALPEFRESIVAMDATVRKKCGYSVLDVLYADENGKGDPFDDILYTHPAIFMVEMALSELFIRRFGPPNYILGASLGEVAAAVVAGCLSMDVALDCVLADARNLDRMGPRGGMLAILGCVELYHQHDEIFENCEIATLVDESHFVVSGIDAELRRLQEFLIANDIKFIRLPVAFPFHSDRFEIFRPNARFATALVTPKIPVISCTTGSLIHSLSPEHSWKTVRDPLHVGKSIELLEQYAPSIYIDLGPGSSLAAVINRRRGRGSARAFGVLTPFGNELTNFRKAESVLLGGMENAI